MTPSPTQSDITTALGQFLTAVLPPGTVVVVGQQNRVAEPTAGNFVVMTPIAFERLVTNLDQSADVKFEGSISGPTLTVSDVFFGELSVGATVFGSGVMANTTISAMGAVPGTWTVSPPQTVAAEEMSCGATGVTQGAQATVQLDFHSADTTAGDMAQTVSTLARDSFGVDFFAGLLPPLNNVVPLYADDPKQMPFFNENQQVEWRWVLQIELFVNQTVVIPQQFADAVEVDVVSVYATDPP